MQLELVHIADCVWFWPPHPDPDLVQASVGVIAGEQGSILVDAGNSPSVADQVRAAMNQAGIPEVRHIVYTHHHWDHIYGACVFQVPVIAHQRCRDILVEEAKKPWSPEYLRELVERNPKLKVSCEARHRAIQDWERFRIVVPDMVFQTAKTINLDGVEIELEHVGGDHAEDSIVVKIPRARVMFIGDCYYLPPLHLRTSQSTISTSLLASLVDEAYDIYVEGHDHPVTRAEIAEFLGGLPGTTT